MKPSLPPASFPTYKIWFITLILLLVALLVCIANHAGMGLTYSLGAISLLSVGMLWRSVSLPLASVRRGMYLLVEQDYSSRLRHVGNAEADWIVDFYNAITANMKAERLKLQEQNRLLDQIIDGSPAGIAICNLDGTIRSSNAAYSQLRSPETDAVLMSLKPGQTAVCRPGYGQILKCSRMSFVDSGFHRSFVIIERLTDEIVEAEQTLFKKIIRIISHEVNNSLAAPRSVLESLADIHDAEPAIASVIRSSIRACNNLASFTHRYAQAVKLPEPELKPIDINGLMRQLQPQLLQLTEGIHLDMDLNDVPNTVMADSMLLERVIVNVVKNAAESINNSSMLSRGRIVIHVHDHTVEISDNGPGLSTEAAQHLFSPFFTTKPSGHGMGLMLCAAILRAHNATFNLSTVHSASGPITTFTFTLS